jgi:hypothetical protein
MEIQNFTPTGTKPSGDELKWGLWFVTHRVFLRKLGILLLGALNLFLFVYVAYNLLNFYFINRGTEKNLYRMLTASKLNYTRVAEISQAQPLTIGLVDVLINDQGNYDILAQVINPNASWYAASVTYHFENGEFKSAPQTTYILPLQEKYLLELNAKNLTTLYTAELIFDSIQWNKTSHFAELRDKIWQFAISEPKFTTNGILEGTNTPVNHVDFTVKNASAYNFRQVDAVILLQRGGEALYINRLPIKDFSSGETRAMSLNIIERLPPATAIQVFPDVNILDETSFKAFSGSGQGY